MPVKPTAEEAMTRLRLDESLSGDVLSAIDQAHALAQAALDGTLYEDATAKATAGDARGIVCTPDIIAAQLLFVDALVGANTVDAAAQKTERAHSILLKHRNMGA